MTLKRRGGLRSDPRTRAGSDPRPRAGSDARPRADSDPNFKTNT